MEIERKMGGKYPVVMVRTDRKTLPLVSLGCLHAGAETHDERKLDATIKWILDKEAIWVAMGDFIENGTKTSPGDGVFRQLKTPQAQMDYVAEKLEPIAHLCIGAIRGNHEERTMNMTGIDPMMCMAKDMRIPYAGVELYANITMDKKSSSRSFSLYANHSKMAAKTEGLEMNAIERDMEKFLNFDIIMKGHGHKAGLMGPQMYLEYDKYSNSVREGLRYYMLSGAFFGDRPNSYAAGKPMRPRETGTVAAILQVKNVHDNKRVKRISAEDLRDL